LRSLSYLIYWKDQRSQKKPYKGSDIHDLPEEILMLPAKIPELKMSIRKVERRGSVHLLMQFSLQYASSMLS
jgi:hypothetical protein